MTKNRSGFTLVELLLYIAIVPLLLGAAIGVYYISTQSRIKQQTVSEVQGQGAIIVDVIADAIRTSDAVLSPAPTASSGSLILTMPNAAVSPTVFGVNANIINVTEGVGAPIPLHSDRVNVANLQFTNLNNLAANGSVQFSFELSYVNSSGRNEYDYSQTFYGSGSLRP